jgi:hypothetical protein
MVQTALPSQPLPVHPPLAMVQPGPVGALEKLTLASSTCGQPMPVTSCHCVSWRTPVTPRALDRGAADDVGTPRALDRGAADGALGTLRALIRGARDHVTAFGEPSQLRAGLGAATAGPVRRAMCVQDSSATPPTTSSATTVPTAAAA